MEKCKCFTIFITLVCELVVITLLLPVILVQEIGYLFKHWNPLNSFELHNLKGKVVLITGASSGIGEGIAKYFYLAGCKVILAARRTNELKRVQKNLRALETKSGNDFVPTILTLDLSNTLSIDENVKKTIAIYGGIDILVNNAGVYNQGKVLGTVLNVDQCIMSVNYLGPLSLTKQIGNHMLQKKMGHVVFVGSLAGKVSPTNSSSYSASKRALQALADILHAEVASKGIDITIVSPGFVNTPILAEALNAKGDKIGTNSKEFQTGYSVEYVSKRTFKAIVNKEMDVIIAPFHYRICIHLKTFAPTMFFYLVRLVGSITT